MFIYVYIHIYIYIYIYKFVVICFSHIDIQYIHSMCIYTITMTWLGKFSSSKLRVSPVLFGWGAQACHSGRCLFTLEAPGFQDLWVG